MKKLEPGIASGSEFLEVWKEYRESYCRKLPIQPVGIHHKTLYLSVVLPNGLHWE